MSIWKTMDTAPKDRSEFLIRYPLQGNVKSLCYRDKIHGCWMHEGTAIFPEEQRCEWLAIKDIEKAQSRLAAEQEKVKVLRGAVEQATEGFLAAGDGFGLRGLPGPAALARTNEQDMLKALAATGVKDAKR